MKTIANKPLTKRLLKKAAMLWMLTSFGYLSAESNAGVSKKMIPTFNLQEQMAASLSSSKDSTAAQVKTEEEVVVTALGIKKEAKAITYATQLVKADELTGVRETNLMNSLSGKVAGIQINRSAGGAGGSVRVVLRGNKSVLNNSPLFVIDGVPMSNPISAQATDIWGQGPNSAGAATLDGGDGISNINPDDIESINVLKGASAAALYGSQASNGAIMINTKKGKKDEFKVEYNLSYTADMVNSQFLPKLQTTYANFEKKITMKSLQKAGGGDSLTSNGKKQYYAETTPLTSSWTNDNTKLSDFGAYTTVAQDSANNRMANGGGIYLGLRNTGGLGTAQNTWSQNSASNPASAFYKVGHTLVNSISISGGTKGSASFFSYSNRILCKTYCKEIK